MIPRFLIALALLLAACGTETRPNVLILVMDTTRADHCSVQGYSRPTTPELERLAASAVVYRNAWSPAGWTGPAHASLFTGLRPEHHGFLRGNRPYLGLEAVTLAERLSDAGYETACFTNNDTLSRAFGMVQGFQTVVPLYQDEDRPYPWAPETHRLALRFARESHHRGRPFFIFVNDMEPHFPYTPPETFARRFRRPGADPTDEAWVRRMRFEDMFAHNAGARRIPPPRLAAISDLYDAEIACLDGEIGRLVGGLRNEGLLHDTVLIVTADHGENLGDHGLVDHMFSLHASIRHVPLLVRYPSRFVPGTVVDAVVRLEDIPLTVLDLCGLSVPRRSDGASLLGPLGGRWSLAVMGAPDAFLRRMLRTFPLSFDAAPLLTAHHAAYDGRYHCLWTSDGREELYDRRADPEESRDLSKRLPVIRDRLRSGAGVP